jgi:hypothetical protein
MELESEDVADAMAIFRHYLESNKSIEFTISRTHQKYHVRVIRIDHPEDDSAFIRETDHDSLYAEQQRVA